ncbi:hypothetical protein IEQ34_001244 [Dendrobium chrysotoxum]|uniref:Uncharacterized protein n=1 Tax=Dendrobium chrysotoxum TaxID=161865 RepID=A0AAV7HM06_DENCH|nr:hypothetical protein IEQ34_001244 [Dendrobium chrysotoxum]
MTSWGTPMVSITKEYFPGDGSELLSHDVRFRSMPIFSSGPSFIPESKRCVDIVNGIPAIGNPDDGLNSEIAVPNAYIAVGGVWRGEEAERKGSVRGDEVFSIREWMRWSKDVYGEGDGEEEEEEEGDEEEDDKVWDDRLSHHLRIFLTLQRAFKSP